MFAGPRAKQGRPGERLARSLERLGPVAIKLGQLLSTRADIFGREFAEDLSRLKDPLEPFPTAVARAEVERELGRPVESLFQAFGGPVADASPVPPGAPQRSKSGTVEYRCRIRNRPSCGSNSPV